ncbi:hypothetical protein LB467_12145 [Salegentibacter sp. JZCK2]|uniref:DUF6616 family protein n=1 Tax=Salegentibacter tibetensis TaxID=2873600 RepID=UPI001CC9779D|nr:DUF6616 family protein [Salegentibacter tibetensis]MBZ9730437.1 hypothetical protein [Salegentibacter tibetensis]
MYLYIEMWNVTGKWIDLSKEKRRELMENMQDRITGLKDNGVENLGWALNDEHTHYRSQYRYVTVWKMPSLDNVETLEENLKKVGWYDYFSQANTRGEIISQKEAIDFLVNLEAESTSLT